MTTNTLGDGSLRTTTALSEKQYETIMQAVTLWALGVVPNGPVLADQLGLTLGLVDDPVSYGRVRVGWPLEGQPGFDIAEDTCILRGWPIPARFGMVRDVTREAGDTTATKTVKYTRRWNTSWTFYGANAVANACLIRSLLVDASPIDDQLDDYKLYVDPAINPERRVPEYFEGQWWPRADLSAQFNEQITETTTVNLVASVEIKTYTKDGELSDTTVQL